MRLDAHSADTWRTSASLIRVPGDITADWLGTVLDRSGLSIVSVLPIGDGHMARCYRVTFDSDIGVDTVVVKFAASDPTTRSVGVDMHVYWREIAFYQDLAQHLDGVVPECYQASYDNDDGSFTLVLEDVAGAEQGDHVAGCSVETARLVMRKLARVQLPALRDPRVADREYLQPLPSRPDRLQELYSRFVEHFRERLTTEQFEVCDVVLANAGSWWSNADGAPRGLVHGDYRLDNMLLSAEDCHVIDWQLVSWGPLLSDAAYFLGGCLAIEDRRAHEVELLREYHDELLRHGMRELSWEQCWREYRTCCFRGVLPAVGGSMTVARNERSGELFARWLERSVQQVLDLDALSLVPTS